MEKINAILRKNVGEIAIGLGVMGIIAHSILYWVKFSGLVRPLLIVHFQDPLHNLLRLSRVTNEISFLSILFLIMLVTGGVLFKISKGKDSRLLKFGFSIIAIIKLLDILFAPLIYLLIKQRQKNAPADLGQSDIMFDFVYPYLFVILFLYISFYLTKWLIEKQDVDYTTEVSHINKTRYVYNTVSKRDRFTHLIFDLFLMLLIFLPMMDYLMLFVRQYLGSTKFLISPGANLTFSLYMGGVLSLYYLAFEGFFQATPLKFLTGTRVVSSRDMKPPSYGTLLFRTIYRRIPFESFSFFGKGGWHDQLSNTVVIYEQKEGQVKFKQGIWIFLLIGVYIAVIVNS